MKVKVNERTAQGVPNDPKGHPQWWRCFSVVKEKQCQQLLLTFLLNQKLPRITQPKQMTVRPSERLCFLVTGKTEMQNWQLLESISTSSSSSWKTKALYHERRQQEQHSLTRVLLCSSHNENRKSECCCCCCNTR